MTDQFGRWCRNRQSPNKEDWLLSDELSQKGFVSEFGEHLRRRWSWGSVRSPQQNRRKVGQYHRGVFVRHHEILNMSFKVSLVTSMWDVGRTLSPTFFLEGASRGHSGAHRLLVLRGTLGFAWTDLEADSCLQSQPRYAVRAEASNAKDARGRRP